MRFSILIPVYNTEKYLDKCLQSVLQEEYNDYEIILTDDGSTDNSKNICEQYAKTDNRIRFFSTENKGLLATRRDQLKICKGDYVLFLDSDDFWKKGILSVLSDKVDQYKPDMICFGNDQIDDEEKPIKENIFIYEEEKEFSIKKENINVFVKKFFEDYRLCNLWNKCVKREIIDIENTYDEFTDVYGEDLLQSVEMVCNAKSVVYLPLSLYYYKQSYNGKGRNLSPAFAIDTMYVREFMYNKILAHNLDKEILDTFLIRCFKDILHRYNCLFYMCKNYREFRHYYKGMKSFPVFGYSINKALSSDDYNSDSKILMMFNHPLKYYFSRKLKYKKYALTSKIMNIIKPYMKKYEKQLYSLYGWYIFIKNRFKQKQMSPYLYKQEYKKYKRILKNDKRKNIIFKQMKAFLTSSFELISDNLVQSEDRINPTVFVVVRNELDRMKVFFEHYRKLGIEQFVVLDNGSDDGTLEYLIEQNGTKVYQILDSFQTHKKEAWIETLLVLNGLNKWCIVVDADELLDYIGSENHSIKEMIKKSENQGYKRIWGFMVDMYAKDYLFEQKNTDISFTKNLRYFDKDSYMLCISDDPNATKLYDEIYGGPRYRLFRKELALSKQSVFFFEKSMLYRSCHFLSPLIKWGEVPCYYVLRHYKFIPGDKLEYERRIREKCFYNDSIEYKVIMEQINKNPEMSMYYVNSAEYIDSNSLKCLPYINEIKW